MTGSPCSSVFSKLLIWSVSKWAETSFFWWMTPFLSNSFGRTFDYYTDLQINSEKLRIKTFSVPWFKIVEVSHCYVPLLGFNWIGISITIPEEQPEIPWPVWKLVRTKWFWYNTWKKGLFQEHSHFLKNSHFSDLISEMKVLIPLSKLWKSPDEFK